MSPGRPRRTQEERRAETRAKLLEAAIESVHEVGYAQTTVRRVSEIAGVSPGAQAHYFPRRVELVAAAVEELAERRIASVREHAGALPDEPEERLRAVLDLLWDDLSGPTFTVFVKLWVAAADDPELYDRLVLTERDIARAIYTLAVEIIGPLAERRDIERMMLHVLSACRGLALTEHFEPLPRRRRGQWPILRESLLDALTPALRG
jgi:AcrR family transcriptional regulator